MITNINEKNKKLTLLLLKLVCAVMLQMELMSKLNLQCSLRLHLGSMTQLKNYSDDLTFQLKPVQSEGQEMLLKRCCWMDLKHITIDSVQLYLDQTMHLGLTNHNAYFKYSCGREVIIPIFMMHCNLHSLIFFPTF